jgi:hypothetical protein
MVEIIDKLDQVAGQELISLKDFSPANATFSTGAKLDAMRPLAQAFHDKFIAGPRVVAVRTLDLITFPYPTRFGLWGAATSPAPYVMMTNRTLLVQFRQRGAIKTLLMNPTDYFASLAAPYFMRQMKRYGRFLSERVLSKKYRTVVEHLDELGIKPEAIDYVSFDHLHVQDLRPLMGTRGTDMQPPMPARFPNAYFIFHRAEVESMRRLHPLQIPWYVPNALKDARVERQILIDGDVMLGDGVAILHTPGHTPGNISLAINTENGIVVTSENGISIDNYHPLESRIPGVRRFAREWGYEVILNANTIEYTAEQYISMVKEKLVAGSGALGKGVPNFFPSSELTASLLAPGLAPTFSRRAVAMGELSRPNS